MEEYEKKIKRIKAIIIGITFPIIAICILFIISITKVEAASYYFDVPRFQNFCKTDIYGYCGDFAVAYDKHMNANGVGQGNYYNVTYMASKNINGVEGNDFIAGEYSVSFSGEIALVPGYTINTNRFRIRLLYYPTSNTEYGVATCDNNENFTITKLTSATNVYKYTYTCETLQISSGKSYLGWNIYITPTAIGPDPYYFAESYITQNLTLIGEGEATNNDIINNANQNAQNIINNANQNTDKITGAIKGPGLSEDSKKPIDKEGINDYTDKEEAIINKNELDKINDIDIVIDSNSNTFIWDLITRILNTNTLVFGMIITILSIGLIKLLLNR